MRSPTESQVEAVPAISPELANFLTKLSARERTAVEKTLAATPETRIAGSFGSELWAKLTIGIMSLGDFTAKLSGKDGLQFFAADGKYRVQVFALQNRTDGGFYVYTKDVLEQAVAKKLVITPTDSEHYGTFQIKAAATPLDAVRMDPDVPDHSASFRNMMSWNRKAIRIDIPAAATDRQIEAVVAFCRLSIVPA
jgi:hypothetical protein